MSDRFSEITEGQQAELFHTIGEKDLSTFVELTGDNNPLHVDDAYAAGSGFQKRVVHGMLTASFISTLIGTKLPGPGSLWYEQTTRFLSPVRIGERIRIVATVKHKSIAQRILTLETLIFGSDGRKVIEGEAKVKLPEQSQPSSGEPVQASVKGVVLITGAARGIGAAIARELAVSRGYAVLINFLRNQAQAESLCRDITQAKGRAAIYGADVRDGKAVREMVRFALQQYGHLEGLVNNACGPIVSADFSELSWEALQEQIDVQLKGAFQLCQAALPHLRERKAGVIVNIGSIYSDNVPPSKMLPYTLAKSGIVALTRALALELGPQGIRVNCVSPGMTQTDLIADVPEKIRLLTKMQTPLRRLGTPEDVAGMVGFLFSDQARHISGETLRVCGGSVMA